jgi:hypothetical protein
MPRPSHYSRFYHPNNIGCRVQITLQRYWGLNPNYCPCNLWYRRKNSIVSSFR